MKDLRVGVVGCSNLGRGHSVAYLGLDGVDVAAFCDVLDEPREWLQSEVFEPRGLTPAQYDDYETMLDKADLDAVSLIVPHTMHFEMCKQALERGIHVLVEKPMVTSTPEAEELVRIVERSGKVLNIAFQGPHRSQVRTARRLIREGRIGELVSLRCIVAQAWLSLLARLPQKKWRLRKAMAGGGQLYDTGSHLINSMLWTSELQPERVYAEIDCRSEEVDVNSAVTVRFTNGAIGMISVLGSTRVSGMGSELLFTGTDGDMLLPNGSHGGGELKLFEATESPEPFEMEDDSSPQRNFVRAIRGEVSPSCPPEYGVRLARLMDAIYLSAEQGHPVTV